MECSPAEIVTTLRELTAVVRKQGFSSVHWIVQQHVSTRRRGHLSNERHLAYENRDWATEVEIQNDRPGYTTTFGVRPWRDGATINYDLRCVSEPQITLRLKQVAMWATEISTRLHFEWVWDGRTIWVVQADAADQTEGVDPTSLRPDALPEIHVDVLRVFETAMPKHYEQYRKLHNAKIYRELGYDMPPFYVLIDHDQISAILQNQLSPDLLSDLRELTKRPVILRTDGDDIPSEKREMLPRSDELRTVEAATQWLISEFSNKVRRSGLDKASVCLLAHHFIPSIASAWARGEPNKPMVRIESLWGLPEGLYWYSHDTFEVDTSAGVPLPDGAKYALWERRRYKGTFIAPDKCGHWIPLHTAASHDWRRSISRRRWLYEIASTTRRIAQQENRPVAVMWFIANDERATRHAVLPWFHSPSELSVTPKAAPRRKLSVAQDFEIGTEADWAELRRQVSAGCHVERVVVEPSSVDLVRNPEFAEELATFAADHNIVVELKGAILSHAYYILRRQGAQVECIDLFGAGDEVVEYNKLVRDRIPAAIQAKGESVDVLRLSGDALLIALRQKLVEEALEALDANAGSDLIGELADLQEVLYAIISNLALDNADVEKERLEKKRRRGGFEQGYMLRKTSTPHSLSSPQSQESMLSFAGASEGGPMIVRPSDIPTTSSYRRPDLRIVQDQPEGLLAFEAEIPTLQGLRNPTRESVTFSIPVDKLPSRQLVLMIEFSRSRSILRSNVRLRLKPLQLEMLESQLALRFDDDRPKEKP